MPLMRPPLSVTPWSSGHFLPANVPQSDGSTTAILSNQRGELGGRTLAKVPAVERPLQGAGLANEALLLDRAHATVCRADLFRLLAIFCSHGLPPFFLTDGGGSR